MNIKPQVCKQPPRKVYKYNKVAWNIIKDEIQKLSNEILKDESHMTTKQMWTKTEEGLQQIINTKVPSKMIKGYKKHLGLPMT